MMTMVSLETHLPHITQRLHLPWRTTQHVSLKLSLDKITLSTQKEIVCKEILFSTWFVKFWRRKLALWTLVHPQSVPTTGPAAGNWYSSFPPPTCKFTFLLSSVERGCVANNIIRFLLISLIVQLFIQLPFSHGEIKTILLWLKEKIQNCFYLRHRGKWNWGEGQQDKHTSLPWGAIPGQSD